jgi:ribosomal protein S27AE
LTHSISLPYSGRLARGWGHRATHLLSGAILGAIALGVRPMTPTLLTLLTSLTLLVFVVVTWLFMRQHDRRLCERCAASMPLNAAEHAARFGRRFRLAHAGGNPRVMVPYLIVLVGSNFLTGPVGRIGWALVQSTMIYLIMAHSSHRKLQPWCPQCSGGGGRSRDNVTEPDLPRGDRLPV